MNKENILQLMDIEASNIRRLLGQLAQQPAAPPAQPAANAQQAAAPQLLAQPPPAPDALLGELNAAVARLNQLIAQQQRVIAANTSAVQAVGQSVAANTVVVQGVQQAVEANTGVIRTAMDSMQRSIDQYVGAANQDREAFVSALRPRVDLLNGIARRVHGAADAGNPGASSSRSMFGGFLRAEAAAMSRTVRQLREAAKQANLGAQARRHLYLVQSQTGGDVSVSKYLEQVASIPDAEATLSVGYALEDVRTRLLDVALRLP